jgi:hypothetical protein
MSPGGRHPGPVDRRLCHCSPIVHRVNRLKALARGGNGRAYGALGYEICRVAGSIPSKKRPGDTNVRVAKTTC